jgi:hypothetical protein
VLVSLIYLSLQLRQGTRHQKASVHHDRLAHLEVYLASLFGDAELMNIQVRGQAADSTLSDTEVNRFVFMQYGNLLFYQEYFLLHSEGMISADQGSCAEGVGRSPGLSGDLRSMTGCPPRRGNGVAEKRVAPRQVRCS